MIGLERQGKRDPRPVNLSGPSLEIDQVVEKCAYSVIYREIQYRSWFD